MEKIASEKAPRALGPYSQAVRVQNLLFVSGQLPIDPKTDQLIEGTIGQMTKQVFENLAAILDAGGSSLEKVVRCEVFLTDLKDFAAMNEEYGKHLKGPCLPARQTIQVSGLPKGSPLEISCIAVID